MTCATNVEDEWNTLFESTEFPACTAIINTGDMTTLCDCMADFKMEQVPDCAFNDNGENVMDAWKSCQSTSTEAGNTQFTWYEWCGM